MRTRIPTPSGAALPNTSLAPAPPPASAVVIRTGIGMLRTFNPGWHNELPELAHIMSDTRLSTEDKIKAMQRVPALQTKFRRYKEHVQALARHFRLPTWRCSFEVSLNAAATGRVHCHDYVCPATSASAFMGASASTCTSVSASPRRCQYSASECAAYNQMWALAWPQLLVCFRLTCCCWSERAGSGPKGLCT